MSKPTFLGSYWGWFTLEIWGAFPLRQVYYKLRDDHPRRLRSPPGDS